MEPGKRRGRPPKPAAPPFENAPTSSSAPPVKRGPGRPRKNATQAAPPPRRSIVQPDEQGTDVASTVPPVKRGPGRPRKHPLQTAAPTRRTIIQQDETQRKPTARPPKRRTIEQTDDENKSEMPAAHGRQQRMEGTLEPPPRKKQRRGLTNIFTSPLSSSVSPVVKSIEAVDEESRPSGQVYQSETSQPSVGVEMDTVQVQPPKRRTIVQVDDLGVLRN